MEIVIVDVFLIYCLKDIFCVRDVRSIFLTSEVNSSISFDSLTPSGRWFHRLVVWGKKEKNVSSSSSRALSDSRQLSCI